jgi:hypothetical protein
LSQALFLESFELNKFSAGLLTYSILHGLPGNSSDNSSVQNMKEFTAAGLFGIYTRFPFILCIENASEPKNSITKVGLFFRYAKIL